MKRAFPTAVALLLWLAAAAALAGPLAPHLIPLQANLTDLGTMGDYYLAVRQRLLGPHRPAGAYIVVTPSFQEEWALQLAWDRGDPFVLVAKADESIYYAVQRHLHDGGPPEAQLLRTVPVSVTRDTRSVTRATGRLVEHAWGAMLAAARAPMEPGRGLDGTSYLLFQTGSDGTVRAGYAWSPRDGTPTAALVELVSALRAYAEPHSDRIPTEAELAQLASAVVRQAGAASPVKAPANKGPN